MATIFTIEDCLKSATKFCRVIVKSFGPRGELSFLISCTGHGHFTTSGITIIEKVQPLHPIAKIILQTTQKHHDYVGDGSKAFLLLLNEIFVKISEHVTALTFTNDARIKLIHGFTFLLHNVLPECFMEIRCAISNLKNERILGQDKDISSIILCLLKMYFSGKFSLSVSDYLSTLVHHFLIKICETWQSVSFGIKHARDNFGVICSTRGTSSISESQILAGIVLSREFAIYPVSKTFKDGEKYIVISAESDSLNETPGISFSIESNETTSRLIDNQFCMFKMFIEQKKKENVSLIISTGKIPDYVKGLCQDYSIQLITMVPAEEINYILELTQVQPVRGLTEKISEVNCGHLEFIRTVQIQNKDLAYLGLKCRKTNCFPYHLILNGPSERICKQYLKEIWNSLKLICLWKMDSDRCNQKCYKEDDVKNCESKLPPLETVKRNSENDQQSVSSEKLHFANYISTGSKATFPYLNQCNTNSCLYSTVCPSGGCWELYLHYILARKKIDNPDLLIACRILSLSLIVIPRTLYINNSCRKDCFPLVWKTVTEKLQSDGELSYVTRWGEINRPNECEEYEPVIAKEILISEVVQLVIQLLRLHCVASVHKLHSFVTS